MPEHAAESDLAELAIAVYIEELVTDKRVLYLGDPESRGPERLAKVARSVDLVSPRARVRGTRRGGRVKARRWPSAEDHGRWDVVVVPDVNAAGLDEEARVEQVRQWLAEDGVLVASSEEPEGSERGLGYEAFFDLLQTTFDSVRMVGQAPFHGFSLVDFEPPGDLEVTFDGSLLEGVGQSAKRYLALCADDDVVLDSYAVIQIPAAAPPEIPVEAPAAQPGARVSELTERVREQQDALDAANVHAEGLEREIEQSRASLRRAQSELTELRTKEESAEKARDELARRVKELEAVSPQDDGFDEEYIRLETALRECGRELTELRVELERRGTLVRDLVEELEETRRDAGPGTAAPPVEPVEPPPPGSDAMASTMQQSADEMQRAIHGRLQEEVERRVGAEAERAEIAFRLDEVRGALAVTEQRAQHDVEEMKRLEAALRGTVRGLNARLAEVTELHQLAQARLTLAEDDRRTAEQRNRDLVKQLAEMREQLELEMARRNTRIEVQGAAPTIPPAPFVEQEDEAEEMAVAEREGKLLGALLACRDQATEVALQHRQAKMESELAREALTELEERVEGMRFGYETRVAELVAELETIGGESERALLQVGELRAVLDARGRTEAALRGELAGTKLRLKDRQEAVDALLAKADAHVSEAPAPVAEGAGEDVRAELERVRSEAEELRRQLEGIAEEAEQPKPELRAMLATRDTMIARLQTELAQASERQRALESERDDKAAALAAALDKAESARVVSDFEAEEEMRELDELTGRLEESERERASAVRALEEARAILDELVRELPEVGRNEGASGDPDGERRLRARVRQLDAEAADREVLLRSLTAQLQERDDRLRALERREGSDGGEEDEPEALRARLLEMEERNQRLADELANEREARRRLEEG